MKAFFYLILISAQLVIYPQTDNALIKKMMTITGTVASLAKVEADLQKDIFKFYAEANEDEKNLIKEELDEIFNADSLISRYVKNYLTVFDRNKVNDILEVYKNPVFLKATELESRNLEDEEIQRYIKNFDSEEISSDRMELVNRIKEAARVSEFSYYAARSSIQVAVAVSAAFAGNMEPTDTEGLVDMILKETESEMDNYLTMVLLLIYEGLSEDELEEYTEFYESTLGKWQTDASITSHLNTLTESAELFTDAFPAKMKLRKS